MAVTTVHRSTSVLGTSTAAFVTAGASEALIMSKVVVCNTDTVGRTVDIHAVPSGGSATASNKIVSALAVSAGDTVTVPGLAGSFVPPGASLHAKASAGSVVNLDASWQKTAQAA